MSVCDVIEVNNEVYVHISKVGDLGNLKAENDRLHKLISQREKKWEKWTTEKTILSTKMSDYLCKYQNIKREYTKQIKISTDRKKEIERLNNIINELKWKPIEEYDKGNYDWVLVKYFDGDYECVPCVAEKRFGKWHSIDEKEIKFEVKYFFDMQQLDKLQELKGSDKE